MKYLILLILGVIALLLSFVSKRAGDKRNDMIRAFGTVTDVFQSDGGNTYFLVRIPQENGTFLEGESISYSKTNQKYGEGDSVPVAYYYGKSGAVFLEIDDPELIPCTTALVSASRVLFVAGIILIVLFASFFTVSLITYG